MVSKEINEETTDDNDVSCRTTNRSIMVPTDNSKRQSRFRRMLSTGSARSTESTTNLSDSSVSGSMTSSKSWQSFSNLLDALELLPDDEDNTNIDESINANLATRKRSDASLTKEQQDQLRQDIKSLSSQNDMLIMRRMLVDDPRHELIPQQHGTKCRKSGDSIDPSTQQQLQVPKQVTTATKGEEGEVEEQFDPQAFLGDLIYGKKSSSLDKKKPIDSADIDTKKAELIPFLNNNRLNKADQDSENDSISLPSSNDSFKDGDDCWLSWPKLKDESEVR